MSAVMGRDDYSFLFDPPKDTDVFTRTFYYPRSPSSSEPPTAAAVTKDVDEEVATTILQSSLGNNRHAATLSKFSTGVFSSNSAAQETVAPFLNNHIPGQVHIPDGRGINSQQDKVYCYRHQPDLRCQRRTPQEDTVAEIQKVALSPTCKVGKLILCVDHGCVTFE